MNAVLAVPVVLAAEPLDLVDFDVEAVEFTEVGAVGVLLEPLDELLEPALVGLERERRGALGLALLQVEVERATGLDFP